MVRVGQEVKKTTEVKMMFRLWFSLKVHGLQIGAPRFLEASLGQKEKNECLVVQL